MSHCDETLLTIPEANRLAAGQVCVSADTIDPSLWRVGDDEATEVHEPMTRDRWVAFLKDWAS